MISGIYSQQPGIFQSRVVGLQRPLQPMVVPSGQPQVLGELPSVRNNGDGQKLLLCGNARILGAGGLFLGIGKNGQIAVGL